MNNENSETIINISQPDPSWDYYLTYHTLLKARFQLDKLIKEVSQVEDQSIVQDEYFQDELSKILSSLNSTLPKIETE